MTAKAMVSRAQDAVVAAAPGAADSHQYLTFTLGSELYAIGILAIKEIIEYAGLTEVPMMPASIRGVINLRGAVVPVMDLAVRFGRQPMVTTKRTCVVIVEVAGSGHPQVMGLVVDAVNAVVEIPAGDIEPPPAFGSRIRAEFISGMGKVGGHFVILLDIDRVLSIDSASALALVAGVTQEELAVA